LHSKPKYRFRFLLPILLCLTQFSFGQNKVGLVLSGGGANAFAHIGVLKALEENNIPIDYITGSSMGAIIGGLYVSGYTPEQIEQMMLSDNFINAAEGKGNNADKFAYYNFDMTPGLVSYSFNPKEGLPKGIPTNFVNSFFLDFLSLKLFSGPSFSANCNFDSLMVPFRCVAADITSKTLKTFSEGSLQDAIRASSTYPFYFQPININDVVYFDGGIYDNFPVDAMKEAFAPDVIIGVNVSYNYEAADENDLISQLKNMLVASTDYSLQGSKGIVLEPNTTNAAFDFTNVQSAVDSGYNCALRQIAAIKELSAKPATTTAQRTSFLIKQEQIKISNVQVLGSTKGQQTYLRKNLIYKKEKDVNLTDLENRYTKLSEDPFIEQSYPGLYKSDSSNTLQLKTKFTKPIKIDVGGNLSSKPINTGYVGISYSKLNNIGYKARIQTFFGKYYSSFSLDGFLYKPGKSKFYLNPYFVYNQWDYFKSRATFFVEKVPSYIVRTQGIVGLNAITPLSKVGNIEVDVKRFNDRAEYYQTENFAPIDTSDKTDFNGYTIGGYYTGSTLNDLQYATQGGKFKIGARYIFGIESYQAGSTASTNSLFTNTKKDWFYIELQWEKYYPLTRKLSLSPMFSSVYSTRYNFSNFKASSIFSPAFQPTLESKTLYLLNFRSPIFAAVGLRSSYQFAKNLFWRTEAYLFKPAENIKTNNFQITKGDLLQENYFILNTSVVYTTPIGPLSLQLNYYDKESQQYSFLFNFGYILFNKRIYQ